MASNNATSSINLCPGSPVNIHVARGAAGGFLVLGGIGFINNVFVDYVIYRLRLYRVLGHVLILSLSASDIIQSFLISIFNSVELLTDSGFPVTQSWCRFTAGISLLAILSTCLNLVGISIDRFIAIFFPLHYPQIVTSKRVYIYLGLLWSLMIIWSILPTFGWNSGSSCRRIGYTICDWGYTLDFQYFTATSIIVLTAVVIVIILQSAIYVMAIKQAKKLYGSKNKGSDLSRAQRKVTRIVAFIVLTFFITYIPWFSLGIRTVVTGIGGQLIIITCAFLLYTNAMINPMVYATSDRNIRKEVVNVLRFGRKHNPTVYPMASTSGENGNAGQQKSKAETTPEAEK